MTLELTKVNQHLPHRTTKKHDRFFAIVAFLARFKVLGADYHNVTLRTIVSDVNSAISAFKRPVVSDDSLRG